MAYQKSNGESAAPFLGLVAAVLFFGLVGTISFWNTQTLLRNSDFVTRTHEVLAALNDVLSTMKDAETGQRGYVMTGDKAYLAPYDAALTHIEERLDELQQLTAEDPAQLPRVQAMREHVAKKLAELAETVRLRGTAGFDAALAVVVTDRGKNEMDALRSLVAAMQQDQKDIRAKRQAEMQDAFRTTVASGLAICALGILLSIVVTYMARRAAATRRRQEWLQAGQLGLSAAIVGDPGMEKLGEGVLKFLSEYMDAHAAVFYADDKGIFRRVATYGLTKDDETPAQFAEGESLVGQATKDGRTFLLRDVPEGYLTVGSALGRTRPRHLVVSSTASDGRVNAVMEFGFVHPLDELALELLREVSESISVAVQSVAYRVDLQNLLEETQRQAEELQSQGEELRVSNEELEEQGRALRESQGRLEQQQAELEQTNAQLEEQAQALEMQRDDLSEAKNTVQQKALELERASRYKSDFLANMSHELRTPLNSSLILAKLLSENPDGNLSDEQVKYAETIQASGNDLLALINDILDLSKIEAGRMEMRPETTPLALVLDDLRAAFEPLATQKGLGFELTLASGCPATIETDRRRLQQILKNLLSNALKFTEKGRVSLNISPSAGGVAFAVTDTGIGVPPEQQKLIFDAFRQADGTVSRKYGGTGLGLSISLEFARLLGGTIALESQPGKGSVFTLALPLVYAPAPARATSETQIAESAPVQAPLPPATPVRQAARFIDDDRDRLDPKRRTILVIEDDEPFARVLYSLARELNFQCVAAGTAEDGLLLARQYLPQAVILDVSLPDNSGLSVLERLKRDPGTRHVPVHIVSASDYAQTALALGAIGYRMKPVKREEISEVLHRLEERLDRQVRRVLVVEDDPVQMDAVKRLLKSDRVETVGATTAAACLELLKESAFDCMVLDLSLPDATGYELLETLSKQGAYSFPPVIVYTARDLSSEQEQALRRYSRSIIIKGAKSPERLLDEVMLFLHQVVSELPPEQQKMLRKARSRDAVLEGRRILIVEDDVRNVYSLTSVFEPRGALVEIARNGREALEALEKSLQDPGHAIDLVLMDVMMPEMDGMAATREIRRRKEWQKLPVIMLTAKAMKDDQERCLESGANDYMAKPLDVEKLLSLVRVWMPR